MADEMTLLDRPSGQGQPQAQVQAAPATARTSAPASGGEELDDLPF